MYYKSVNTGLFCPSFVLGTQKIPLQRMNQSSVIKLNVGGQTFYTYQLTLSTSNYFKNLMDGEMKDAQIVKNDQIFIDRSGYLFEYILQFLRTTHVTIEGKKLQALKEEADFYQFDNLVAHLKNIIENPIQLQEKYELVTLKDFYKSGGLKKIPSHEANTHGTVSTTSTQIVEIIDVLAEMRICEQPHDSRYTGTDCSHEESFKSEMNVLVPNILLRKIDYGYKASEE